ncbi:hypothetical protein CSUI_009713 [Cystoisospora suis]|uniref:Uncharacterized protein n=1 Tax=Cystoisospora suis TaxID=483139 RepID=A0A2C6KJA0_9APIC|nr:hypothetical protein CSUI_009713 [Cystoisospora suis]
MLFALRELDGRRLYDSHVQVRPDTSSVAAALPPPVVPATSGGGLSTAVHHHRSATYDPDAMGPQHSQHTGGSGSSSSGSSAISSRRRLVPPVALPIEVLPPPRAPLITRTGGGIGVTRHSLSPPRSRLIPSSVRYPAPSGSAAVGGAAGDSSNSTSATIITPGSRPRGVVAVSPGGRVGEMGGGGLGLSPSHRHHHEEEQQQQQVGRGSYGVRTATSPTRGGGAGTRGRSPWSRHHHSYQDGERYYHHGSHRGDSGGSSRGGRLLPHNTGGGGGLSPSSRKEKRMLLPSHYRRSSSRGRGEDSSNSTSRRFSPRGERRGIYYENRREPRVDQLDSSRYYSPSERGERGGRRMTSGERPGGYIHDRGRSHSRYSPLPRDSMKEGSPSRYHPHPHRRDERDESIERIDSHYRNRSPPHAFSRRGRGTSSASPAPPPPPRRLPPPPRLKGGEISEEILDDGDEVNSSYRDVGRRGERSRSSSRAYYQDTRMREEDGSSSGPRGRGGEAGVKKRDWAPDVSCDREYERPGSSRGGRRNHVTTRSSVSHSRERGRFDTRRLQDGDDGVDQYHHRNKKDLVRVSSVDSGRQGRGGEKEGGRRGESREMVRGGSPPAGGLLLRGVFNRGQTHTVSLSPEREAKDEAPGGRMISAVPDPLEDGGIEKVSAHDERERRVPPPLSSSSERRGEGLPRRRDKAVIGHRRVYEERSKSRSISPHLQRLRRDRHDEIEKSLSPSRLPRRESSSHRVVSLVSERKRGGDHLVDSPPRRIERMYPEDRERDTRQLSPSISSSSRGRDDQERPPAGRRQRSPSFRKDSERSSVQSPPTKKLAAVTSSRSRRGSHTSSGRGGGDIVDEAEGSSDMRHRRRLSDGGAMIEEEERDLRRRRLDSPAHSGRGKIEGVSTVQKSRRLTSASSVSLREDEERRDHQVRSRSRSLVEKGGEPYPLPSGGVDGDDDEQKGGKREGGGRREEDSSTVALPAKAEDPRGTSRLNRRRLPSVSNERERHDHDDNEREDDRDHASGPHDPPNHRSPPRRLSSTQGQETEGDSLSIQGQQREDERDVIKRSAASRAGSREATMKGGAGRAQRREGESCEKMDGRSIRGEGPDSSSSGREERGEGEHEAIEFDHDEKERGQRRYHDDGHSDEGRPPKRTATYIDEKGREREYEMEEGDEDDRRGFRGSRDTRRRSMSPSQHERERVWKPSDEGEDFDPTGRNESHEMRDGIGVMRNKGGPSYVLTEREVSLKPRSDRREGGEKGRAGGGAAGGEASSSSYRYSEEDSHHQKRQQKRDDHEEEIGEIQRRKKKPYEGGVIHRDDYQQDNSEKDVSSRDTTTKTTSAGRRGLPPLRSGRSADSNNSKGPMPPGPPAYDEELEGERPIDSHSGRSRKGTGGELTGHDREEPYDEDDVRGATGGGHDGVRERQEEQEGRRKYRDGHGADKLEESRHQDSSSSRRTQMKRDEGGVGRVEAAYENSGRRYEDDDHHHRHHEDDTEGGVVGDERDYHRESRQEILDEEIDRSERGRKGDVPPSPRVVHAPGSSSRNARDNGDLSRERRRRGSSQSSHTGRSFQDSLPKERGGGEETTDRCRRSSRTAAGAVEISNHRNRKMDTGERDPGGGGEEPELVPEKDSTRRRADDVNRGVDGGREEDDHHTNRRGKALDEENDERVVVEDDLVRGVERTGKRGYLPPTSTNSTNDFETDARHHHRSKGSSGGVVVIGGRSRPDYSPERDSRSTDGVRKEMEVLEEVDDRDDSYRREDGEGANANDDRLVDSMCTPSDFSRSGASGSSVIPPPHRLLPSSRPLSSRECGRGRGGEDGGAHGSADVRFPNQGGEHDKRGSTSRVVNEGAPQKRSRVDHDDDGQYPVKGGGGSGGVYEGGEAEGRGEYYSTNKRSRGDYYRPPPRSSAQGERHVIPERQSMHDEDDSNSHSRSRGHHYHPRTENGPRGYSSHHNNRLFSPGGRPMEGGGGGDIQKVNILPVPRKQYVGDPQPYNREDDKGNYSVATPPGSRGGGKYFKTASSGVGGDSLRTDGRHIDPYNNSSNLLPPGHQHHHPRQFGHGPGGGEGGGPSFSEGHSYHHSHPGARRPVTLTGGGGTGGGFPHHGGGQLLPPRREHSPPLRGGVGMRRYAGGGGPAGGRMRS